MSLKLGRIGSSVSAMGVAVASVLGLDGKIRGGDGFALERRVGADLGCGGTFSVECFDRAGHRRWVADAKNAVTNVGLNYLLNATIPGGTQIATWYCGLIDLVSFQQLQATDTMASHTGWAENTAYTPTGRVAWSPATSTAQTLTNANPMTFAMNPAAGSPATIVGLFISSDPNSNAASITLFSTARFSGGNQQVNNGDTLKVTYSLVASSS